MNKNLLKKLSVGIILSTVLCTIMYMAFSGIFIPEKITIYESQKLNTNKIYSIKLVNKSGVLKNGKITEDMSFLKEGTYDANLNIMGINVKPVKVNVIKKRSVIPVGRCIGITLMSDGLLVVGTSEISTVGDKEISPAKISDIRTGDVIKEADGKVLKSSDELKQIIENSKGNKIQLAVLRKSKLINTTITPVMDKTDCVYKIGVWLRDSTAGIGTLTYINPEDYTFASLGHGITDQDTGKLIPSQKGIVADVTVVAVKKGKRGEPGELQGAFLSGGKDAGEVNNNTASGVFGTIYKDYPLKDDRVVEVALSDEIKCGNAVILSNIDQQNVREYSVEIEKINTKTTSTTKNMIIRITDPELLNKTGGIVQGMSGSPIIQNGKIIGAVTHVFVNDPTRGYGIFIENMLAETEKIK